MYTASTQIRVRYAETDQMAYVYYGNYAMYYEVARVEALKKIGFSYGKLEEEGIMMPVHENYSKYYSPAKYDQLLTIQVTIPEIPKVRMRFNYEIRNEQNELINEGMTSLVFVNIESNKLTKAPKELIQVLEPYFDEK